MECLQGLDAAVSEAIFEAALPRQAGDALPASQAGLIVSESPASLPVAHLIAIVS